MLSFNNFVLSGMLFCVKLHVFLVRTFISETVSNAVSFFRAEGVTIFVIGIGKVDPQEIDSAASQPTCVHVFLLQQFSSIDNILYEVRRRSCKGTVM